MDLGPFCAKRLAPETLMSIQPINVRATDSAEKKVSAGINRAFEMYGANLAAFFNAVRAEIKTGERKAGTQLELPLTKSK
jgi:hypothetical protein